MTKNELIDRLARERAVEQIARRITRRPIEGNIKDLCQIVYLSLLEYPDDKLIDLAESDAINFFIVRLVLNEYRSAHSRFHRKYRKPLQRSVPIEWARNIADEEDGF